ncbi:MAG: hypothetical protein HZB30_12440 [Nitrospirae bacterium]|nr:hypothetical protein [Nitrospirota bacterium]
MKYFKYLKNSSSFYIISGLAFGLAVLSLVAIHRYNNSLRDTLNTVESINLKEDDIKKEITQIDTLIKYFQDNFGVREKEINSERLILQALDDMKTHLNNASINISRFEEAPGVRQLSVEIKIPVNGYRTIIDYVNYIESFSLPKFRIKNLMIIKEETGGVVLDIQGGFVIPLKANS